jgi:hypothetical protein
VIQSVFDHSQLLVANSVHASLLGNLLALQYVGVRVAATLPTAIWIGKVGLHVKALLDGMVMVKFFAVVHRQRLHRPKTGQRRNTLRLATQP